MRSAPLFILIALFSGLTLTACFTPQKVITMESAEQESTKWNYGREVVIAKQGDLEARIYFDDFTKNDLIFDIEVVNLGEEDLLLDPAEIYLTPDIGNNRWSFDPEKEIFGEQVELSKRDARSKNTALAVGVATVAAVVAVAATADGDGGDDNDFNDNDGFFDGNTYVYVNNTVPPPPMQYFPPNINFWKDYALRKTTLDKGYKVRGKVVFPRIDQARDYTLSIPIGDKVLQAAFHQRVFQP